jgi:hypothetical protein
VQSVLGPSEGDGGAGEQADAARQTRAETEGERAMKASDVRPGDLIRFGGIEYTVIAAHHLTEALYSGRMFGRFGAAGRRRAKVILYYRRPPEKALQTHIAPDVEVDAYPKEAPCPTN